MYLKYFLYTRILFVNRWSSSAAISCSSQKSTVSISRERFTRRSRHGEFSPSSTYLNRKTSITISSNSEPSFLAEKNFKFSLTTTWISLKRQIGVSRMRDLGTFIRTSEQWMSSVARKPLYRPPFFVLNSASSIFCNSSPRSMQFVKYRYIGLPSSKQQREDRPSSA